MSSFSDREGPWQPLRSGMPIPSAGIGDSPKSRICFSTAWWPAINQALTLLIRPEAWAGDLVAVRAAVGEAQDLLGSLEPCPSPPNWRLVLAVNEFCTALSQNASLWGIPLCNGDPCARAYAGIATQPPVGEPGIWRIAVAGRTCPGASLVGGRICDLYAIQTDSTIGNVWALTWKDCLGATHVETPAGDELFKSDFICQYFCLASLAPFAITLSITGDSLCGVA